MAAATLTIVQSGLRNDQRNLDGISQANQTIVELGGSIEGLNLIPKVAQLPNCPRDSFGAAHQSHVVPHNVLNSLHVTLYQGRVCVCDQSAFIPWRYVVKLSPHQARPLE